jgi:hypothetical protein
MSASEEPRAIGGLPAGRDASWQYRGGLTLTLCGMALLPVGPVLPWFHTEVITPQPGFAGAPSTSLRVGLLGTSLGTVSGVLGLALNSILALGASLSGIRTLAAAARRQPRRGEASDARIGVLASLCGAGLLGLIIVGLASMNSRIPFDWTEARVALDAATLRRWQDSFWRSSATRSLPSHNGRPHAQRRFDTAAPRGL